MLIVVLLLSSFAVCTQNSLPSIKHLTVEDGLSNNWVKSVLKDKNGFMWFGTFNGLNRYDGQKFKTFHAHSNNLLGDNIIEALCEDKEGNIWVGTFSGGLHKYDQKSNTFIRYQYDPNDENSISSNRVFTLFCDKDGQIWIGTEAGLDLFIAEEESFKHYRHDKTNQHSITEGLVSCIHQDQLGFLWVGTDHGLNIFDKSKGNFHRFNHNETNMNSLAQDYVKSIYEDKYGSIWVGTLGGGLDKFNSKDSSFQHHQHHSNTSTSLSNNSILSVSGDGENNIYIATEGGGLNLYNIRKNEFTTLLPDLTNLRSINSNSIHSLYYDQDNGILWAGSYNGGLNYFSRWDKPFNLYQARVNGLNNNHINCITEDRDGLLWIGTDGGGLNVLNESTGSFNYYRAEPDGSGTIINDAVLSVLCDNRNRIWIGTYNGGLDVLTNSGETIARYTHDPEDSTSLSDVSVSAIYQDQRGNIWVGTMSGGLNRLNSNNQSFTRYQHDKQDSASIIDNFIYNIYEDRFGRILILTGKGIEVFDYKTERFKRFEHSTTTNIGVPTVLYEDSQGNLWIGSQENGLFRVDRTGVKITTYTIEDGLSNNSISGILEDDIGNLWISTQRGLCKFEEGVNKPERIRFQIYTPEDGLQGSEFKRGAFCKKQNGNMVFAGQNGFNIFNPLSIKTNPFVPPVKITALKLFNKNVDFRNSDILSMPVSLTDEIRLKHNQSVITFEFSALNYLLSEKNRYAYMMEGFEETWNNVGTQSNATYSNLDPGHYVFRVRASNNDGVWNDVGAKISLIIIPPWWENWYFRGAILLLLVGVGFGYHGIRTYHLKMSKKELERKIALSTADLKKAIAISEERQMEIQRQNNTLLVTNRELERQSDEMQSMAGEIKELNEAKIRFFTNISHELRTPLNLIIWPLDELMASPSMTAEQRVQKFRLMSKNANKLIKLINQLLDIRKVETGTLKLSLNKQAITPALNSTIESFNDWAQRKEINYVFNNHLGDRMFCFDEDKIDKVMSNLLSNAFKYVNSGGQIVVTAQLVTLNAVDQLQIEVQDNGKGISEEELRLIFNRFYEGESSLFPGSGIGLSLVKDLVELHGGMINVRSTINEGSTFSVLIPATVDCTEEQSLPSPPTITPFNLQTDISSSHVELVDGDVTADSAQLAVILLVEDNHDVLQFMQRKLKSEYNVKVASNGREGVQSALTIVPDMIISDIMMPEIDGFELCKTLKRDERTSHIPIILVTARSGDEHQLEGLSFGADDYITKPFKFEVLDLKIKNLLYTRQKLKEHYLKDSLEIVESFHDKANEQFYKDALTVSEKFDFKQVDAQFLKKAVIYVMENIQNESFGVEEFSQCFEMSRRNVLRKIKAMTGLSINEFIRNIRLKKSYNLLSGGNMNVSEAAYAVGFNDPKYFSNCFKKQFGKSPSEIKSTHK